MFKYGKSIITMAIICTLVPFFFNDEKVLDFRIAGLYLVAGYHGLEIGRRLSKNSNKDIK